MATTLTKFRTIGGILDGRIRMANASIRRPLSIGNSWSKLRIAVRACFEDPLSNLPGVTPFVVGVCSGTSNPWNNGTATTTHFVGTRYAFSSGGWNRVTSGANVGFTSSTGAPIKRVGTTDTVGTGHFNDSGLGFPAQSDFSRSGMMFVDITKGNPNFTINVFNGIYTAAHVTRQVFYDVVSVEAAVLVGHAFRNAQTLAVNEGVDGALNTLNIAWSRFTPVLEISDVAVVRWA